MSLALWIVQWLLAGLFVFAGVTKLVLPAEKLMGGPVALPVGFLRFIGVVETLGGLGLILPALLRIQPRLTSLAALGLTVVMIGAVAVTLAGGEVAPALVPFVVGLLAVFVAYGRWRLAPHRRGGAR